MVDLIITPPLSSSRLCIKCADSIINVTIVNARGEQHLNGLLQATPLAPPTLVQEIDLQTVPPTLDFTVPEHHIAALEYDVRHDLPSRSGFLMSYSSFIDYIVLRLCVIVYRRNETFSEPNMQ